MSSLLAIDAFKSVKAGEALSAFMASNPLLIKAIERGGERNQNWLDSYIRAPEKGSGVFH